jgi:hypothetical protein
VLVISVLPLNPPCGIGWGIAWVLPGVLIAPDHCQHDRFQTLYPLTT